VAAQSMNVLSVTGVNQTTSDNPNLYLYAEIFPATATYRSVTWSLSAGDEVLASINQNGRLQAKLGNPGGWVTVKAVTIDGSNISATKEIYIEPYSDEPAGGDDPGNDDPISVMGVSLDQSFVRLEVSQAFRLNATVSPSNATDKSVSWYSSDESVATVDATGLVKAVAAGEADITVTTTDGGYQAICRIIVEEGEGPGGDVVSVTGVSLDPSFVTLEISQTYRLNAIVSPSNATNRNVLWYSMNSDVASVDATGLVRALSAGETDITVTTVDGGYEAICHVTVKAGEGPGGDSVSVTGVSLDPSSVTLDVSQTVRLNATVLPSNAPDKTVSWRSSNTSVATVDATGLVKAVAAGEADIIVTTKVGGYEASCHVTVKGNNPTATDNVKLTGVNVYPNPSDGLFNVETPCAMRASVYTEQGRLLGSYSCPAAGRYEIDLRHKPSGIYFLRLSAPHAERTLKLVVE
ncbi:MAG: Ig-like domain-containing protein, partial [Bacteroidales bacterium]|nr:Ig-like domain-containing protein [Bacteroidales bacterium]